MTAGERVTAPLLAGVLARILARCALVPASTDRAVWRVVARLALCWRVVLAICDHR